MTKQEIKLIEYAFFNYKKLMDNVVISTVEWAESGLAIDYSKPKVKSSANTKKEDRLCALIDTAEKRLKWCRVVEKVLDYYKWDCRQDLIRKRYFEKQPFKKICIEIGICERTSKYWKDEILLKAYQWAKEFNVL